MINVEKLNINWHLYSTNFTAGLLANHGSIHLSFSLKWRSYWSYHMANSMQMELTKLAVWVNIDRNQKSHKT